jgi:hypothetical protein
MRVIIILLLLVLLLAGGVLSMSRWRENSAPIVKAEIAGVRFAYPVALARDEPTRAGGTGDRLAFVASFPGFVPLRPMTTPLGPAAQAQARNTTVFLTVGLKDDGLDPAERPNQLYARFLQGDAQTGPGGLVTRQFEVDSPYELEQLYVAPPDGHSFFARCPKPETETPVPDRNCLWLFREGPFDIELRFDPALLPHWRALAEGAKSFVLGIKPDRAATQPNISR